MKIPVKISSKENMRYFKCDKDTIVQVELEEYIAAVVASEIGNGPIEALKAQAIASRTFAASRGVLDGKPISDLGSKAQAYRAPRTDYKLCNSAAKETAGLVLMYGGRYASTYFCHSNGGQCKSSEEVWGGKRPYLVSRKDPWTKEKRNGHCVGLSQVGAIEAAKQGVGYKEILSFYYPKTTLEHLEIKSEEEEEYERKVLEEIKIRVEIFKKEIGEAL